jgi:hypothetical protein
MKGTIFPILLCVGMLFAASCAGTARFDYAAAPGIMVQYEPLPGAPDVAVLPFTDMRNLQNLQPEGNVNQSSTADQGSFAIGWIPLMPCGWVSKSLPEAESGSGMATLNSYWCLFSRELAEAASASLEFSKLFAEIQECSNSKQATTKWLFNGSYHDTTYDGYRITYGLSYIGAPLLWLVGFPDAVSRNRLALHFELVERTTGKVVWTFDYTGQDYVIHWLYARVGADASLYPRLMKTAMNAAIHDLYQRFAEGGIQ